MNAYLLLANGMVFAGQSVGAEGVTVGEVVFATGMVGFEETLTDPSYYGQIITQTYPLIGNYGMNQGDMESDRIWARGYIVREACTTPSNWRCEETLDSFLKKNNTIGIEGIDTRHLTRIIRESGVMNGAILTTFDPADPANKAETDKLLETIRVMVAGYDFEEWLHGAYNALTPESYLFICRSASRFDYKERVGKLEEVVRPFTEHVFVIGADDESNPRNLCAPFSGNEYVLPLEYIIPYQMMIALLPQKKGINADRVLIPNFHTAVGSKSVR